MSFDQNYLKYKYKYFDLQNKSSSFYFAVYLFSKDTVTEDEKSNILSLLKSLYGDNTEILTNTDLHNNLNEYYLELIKNFGRQKGDEYKLKNNIISFKINSPSDILKAKPMDNSKLIHEEDSIRDGLTKTGINNITLVQSQPGLWDEGSALIGLHKL